MMTAKEYLSDSNIEILSNSIRDIWGYPEQKMFLYVFAGTAWAYTFAKGPTGYAWFITNNLGHVTPHIGWTKPDIAKQAETMFDRARKLSGEKVLIKEFPEKEKRLA